MAITLSDLTVNFDHLDGAALLDDWRWLVGDTAEVVLISAVGDAFLHEPMDGTIRFLATGSGELETVAETAQGFSDMLGDVAFVTDRFAPGLVIELRKLGQSLAPGQVYGYKTPPALGGTYDADNVEPTDISVHFSMLGQILRQARDLPPGTPISRVAIE